MLKKIIKKDRNVQLEEILEQKKIDEQAKNLLQGILYKIEVSYNDYKKVKGKKQTEEKYVQKILGNIQKSCNNIRIVKSNQILEDEKIQKELEQNKYYVGEEIISYPIDEKILYAIEKKSNNLKILNNKYEEATIAISELINVGKNLDTVEVLRDFNGWSWATTKKEIDNIEANLIFQMLQIIMGEEFLEDWCKDKDGIIDYLEKLEEEIIEKFGTKVFEEIKKLLVNISIVSIGRNNKEFSQQISEKIQNLDNEIERYSNTEKRIIEITNSKKQCLKELNKIEQILSQDSRIKEEYEKLNEDAPINKKIFNIKVFVNRLKDNKKNLLEKIEQYSYLTNPLNYLEEKDKLIEQKQKLDILNINQEQLEEMLISFIDNFLICFKKIIQDISEEEEIIRLIYQFRYFLQLPFNLEKNIKDIEKLKDNILVVEKELVNKAIQKKVIVKLPFEVMEYVFNTRIIVLEELYYKITTKFEKNYVQIFDENVKEEKFEIQVQDKTRMNKKIKIFI